MRAELELVLIAAIGQDAQKITEDFARIGEVPADFEEPTMLCAIQELLDEYSHQSLSEFDLSGCLREIVDIIREHRIYLSAKVAMLLKVLIMFEGTAQQDDLWLLGTRFSWLCTGGDDGLWNHSFYQAFTPNWIRLGQAVRQCRAEHRFAFLDRQFMCNAARSDRKMAVKNALHGLALGLQLQPA